MRMIFSSLFLFAVLLSCKNDDKKETKTTEQTVAIDSTLITDNSWGPIHETADIDTLKAIYTASNLRDERICGPECADSIDVTFIYPETAREIIVYWQDSFYHKKINFLESTQPGSPYHTASGLKVGSSLNDILKVNGKPISFSGFGWDYGGFVQSYNGGSLDKSPIQFRLDIELIGGDDLMGEQTLTTDMPNVQKMADSIKVWHISYMPTKNE